MEPCNSNIQCVHFDMNIIPFTVLARLSKQWRVMINVSIEMELVYHYSAARQWLLPKCDPIPYIVHYLWPKPYGTIKGIWCLFGMQAVYDGVLLSPLHREVMAPCPRWPGMPFLPLLLIWLHIALSLWCSKSSPIAHCFILQCKLLEAIRLGCWRLVKNIIWKRLKAEMLISEIKLMQVRPPNTICN